MFLFGKMKIVTFTLSALSLVRLAVGLPHGMDNSHRFTLDISANRTISATPRFHKRLDIITHYTTANSHEVIVWVYEDGRTASLETRTPGIPYPTSPPVKLETGLSVEPTPIPLTSSFEPAFPSPVLAYTGSISRGGGALSTPAAADAPPSPSLPAEEATAQSSGPALPIHQLEAVPAPVPEPAQVPPPAPGSPSAGLGICYSPYNADGTCKTQDQVDSDIRTISESGYHTVRLYGVDCNQIQTVTTAASAYKMRIFAGLLSTSDVAGDLASMISQVNNHFDPDVITTVSIGNELVDTGKAGPGDVVAALGMAREILREAGYQGAVVTVDTFNALIKHPELCAASDYCAANAHAFFDGTVEPDGAGEWVVKQVGRISDAAAGAGAIQGRDDGRSKKVVITESGWPHAGASNGAAVPSPENQARALDSIRAAFHDDLFIFSAFDDKWKDPGAFGVEKNWGII